MRLKVAFTAAILTLCGAVWPNIVAQETTTTTQKPTVKTQRTTLNAQQTSIKAITFQGKQLAKAQ